MSAFPPTPQPAEYPKLRPGLAAAPDEKDPRYLHLWDQFRIGGPPVRVTRQEFAWLRLFTGEHSLRDVQAEAMRRAGGLLVGIDVIAELVRRLDEALFLDGPRFAAVLDHPDREPACVGCYDANPERLRRQMRGLFTGPGGPGLPREPGSRLASEGRIRAALVPHIDYARGGVSYGWGFKEVFERTDASLFVVVGTSHYSPHRYTLTRKNFKSPLGKVQTDQAYIDRLAGHYGDGLFDDPLAHLPEHSIELEVVLLQFLYEGRKPFRIVPLVVGSFGDCVEDGDEPAGRDDVGRMVEALRRAEAETKEPICYLISGDLAHVGPKFGDPEPVAEPFLTHSHERDHAILREAERADPKGYFRVIAEESDARRICGLPPTYTLLEALKPGRGRVLHYGRHVHPRGFESVSFASVAFDE